MDFTKVETALKAHGFRVTVCPGKAEASAYLNQEIDGKTVGFGGSMTLRELGLYASLSTHNTVMSHWDVPEGKSEQDMRNAAASAEVYISSVNALAETGELINIDGSGNRVAGTLYGHKKVYLVVGRNKLAPDYEQAVWRARNIAAPKNALRLKRRTPCAATGGERCFDCRSPERICRALVVLWRAMFGCEAEVVLVDEDLGY